KAQITIRHLGSHTSGIEDAEADDTPHERLTGWKGDFWKRLNPPSDPFTLARDETSMLFAPSEKLQYSNPGAVSAKPGHRRSSLGAQGSDSPPGQRQRQLAADLGG